MCLDGPEHYTSFRLAALSFYPDDFDVAEQIELCRRYSSESDGVDRGLAAKAFGFGGVGRERAYNDALLDLGAPAMGLARVLRVPPDADPQPFLRRLDGS